MVKQFPLRHRQKTQFQTRDIKSEEEKRGERRARSEKTESRESQVAEETEEREMKREIR